MPEAITSGAASRAIAPALGTGEEGSGLGGSAMTGASGVRGAGRRLQSKLKPEGATTAVRIECGKK